MKLALLISLALLFVSPSSFAKGINLLTVKQFKKLNKSKQKVYLEGVLYAYSRFEENLNRGNKKSYGLNGSESVETYVLNNWLLPSLYANDSKQCLVGGQLVGKKYGKCVLSGNECKGEKGSFNCGPLYSNACVEGYKETRGKYSSDRGSQGINISMLCYRKSKVKAEDYKEVRKSILELYNSQCGGNVDIDVEGADNLEALREKDDSDILKGANKRTSNKIACLYFDRQLKTNEKRLKKYLEKSKEDSALDSLKKLLGQKDPKNCGPTNSPDIAKLDSFNEVKACDYLKKTKPKEKKEVLNLLELEDEVGLKRSAKFIETFGLSYQDAKYLFCSTKNNLPFEAKLRQVKNAHGNFRHLNSQNKQRSYSSIRDKIFGSESGVNFEPWANSSSSLSSETVKNMDQFSKCTLGFATTAGLNRGRCKQVTSKFGIGKSNGDVYDLYKSHLQDSRDDNKKVVLPASIKGRDWGLWSHTPYTSGAYMVKDSKGNPIRWDSKTKKFESINRGLFDEYTYVECNTAAGGSGEGTSDARESDATD